MTSQVVVNDFIQRFHGSSGILGLAGNVLNVDKDKLVFDHDAKGHMSVNGIATTLVMNNRKEKIDLLEFQRDRFDRSYAELNKAFSYPILKVIIDTLKEQYPNAKVYSDLKKVYALKVQSIEYVTLSLFYNEGKQTINIMLKA
jgi:hypothetical protein